MNETTRNLLMKLRRQSVAGFGVKEWNTVLTELGFGFAITGTGVNKRQVTEVTVTSPLGQTLVISKDPRYKAIHFYALPGWVKSIGVDLVDVTSIRLGMDSPEQEAKLKALYIRDLTNTGTCSVCGGNFKREADGSIGHHGYTRPGDGMLHGTCFGVGFQPWEVSSAGAVAYLQALGGELDAAKEVLAATATLTSFREPQNSFEQRLGRPVVVVTAESPYRFAELREAALYKAQKRVDAIISAQETYGAAVAAWKEDVLPEVKHAGKFRKVG